MTGKCIATSTVFVVLGVTAVIGAATPSHLVLATVLASAGGPLVVWGAWLAVMGHRSLRP